MTEKNKKKNVLLLFIIKEESTSVSNVDQHGLVRASRPEHWAGEKARMGRSVFLWL